jgi:vacuolar-type H+-ATPase subunit H
MKAEIEKIIQSDETAQKEVKRARMEAKDLLAGAKKRAEELISKKHEELDLLKKQEVERVVSEARAKAQKILDETDHYLEMLRAKKAECFNDLVNDLVREVRGS